MNTISIIIPIHNKTVHLPFFVAAIRHAINTINTKEPIRIGEYEIIFVTNNPDNILPSDNETQPFSSSIHVYTENKNMSEAELCAKGFASAAYDTIVKIDVDLQSIQKTIEELIIHMTGKDVAAALQVPKSNRNFITRHKNSEAGALIFSKHVWDVITFTSSHANTFNQEFFHRAIEAGFIGERFFVFEQVTNNSSHLSKIKQVAKGLRSIIQMKTKRVRPQFIPPSDDASMQNAGFGYKKQQYVTHTTLQSTESAVESFMLKQVLLFALIGGSIMLGLLINPLVILQLLIGILSIAYVSDVIFNLYLVLKTIRHSNEITVTDAEMAELKENELPIYTILCPLFKEAHILPQFLDGIAKIAWPKDKLDVCLLLESNDFETLLAVDKMNLPSHVRVIVVPHSFPKTKPKACNYGLIYAKGEYLVIYDAEDIPDPLQLKKAYIGFMKSDRKVVCLQAKLSYYNVNQNLLTRFFAAEYSLWFDITLKGLQSINTIIPLGGTSNHFRVEDLKKLSAWDPFNVTEDADLGIRLFKEGYQTAVLDSNTLEEANSKVGNWLRQRSRWIKGYMQTYLVHTRETLPFIKKRGIHAFIFHLTIGGKLIFILVNPLLWAITISYFLLPTIFGPVIETFYPTPILYIAITSLIFGNSLYLFNYIMGCVKKEEWGLIKYIYLIPLYWGLISIAGYIAFYQLLFKPHYWEKTVHGLHLKDPVLQTV